MFEIENELKLDTNIFWKLMIHFPFCKENFLSTQSILKTLFDRNSTRLCLFDISTHCIENV